MQLGGVALTSVHSQRSPTLKFPLVVRVLLIKPFPKLKINHTVFQLPKVTHDLT